MKGDFTRLTYDPVKHYSSVRLQQGRVLLDADWNEELDILTHRIETEAIDVIGACGVPKHSPGFALSTDTSTVSAADQARLTAKGAWPLKAGDFLIGAGRAYVDGILCENDQLITFTSQADLPGVQPIQAGGTYVAYLDVWQRHLTALEDPAIREVALGGPDTTTRTKTVWQVKLLPAGEDGSNVSCADETQWPLASTGQLSARTEPVPPEDDPCIVPPGAGYRRLENQLYRIEIHQGSDETGGPTFKWSRDNGSIVVAVEEFNANGDARQIQVKSLGRDDVLGLHKFDWVEVSDDASELSGQHGTLAQILDIDTEHRVLILDTSIGGYNLDGHAKVRRWDSAGELAVEVPITNDGYLKIEDGVEIKFDVQHFNTGDYWLIPARTVPGQYGDIEWPRDSGNNPIALLPLGIQHHYCKLGILTVTGAEENVDITNIEDCRQIFPPLTELPVGGECCCTVSVGDGVHSQGDYTDIQTAIDALPEDGGQVCILSGTYTLDRTVVLRSKRDVTIAGCGNRSIVIGPREGPVFLIEGGQNIEVNSLSIRGQAEPAAILARKISDLRILNCTVINRGGRKETRTLAAFGTALPTIVVVGGLVVEIKHNRIGGLPAIIALARGLQIDDNLLRFGGVWIRSGSGDVVIEHNDISDGQGPGIRLGDIGEEDTDAKEFIIAGLAAYRPQAAFTTSAAAAQPKVKTKARASADQSQAKLAADATIGTRASFARINAVRGYAEFTNGIAGVAIEHNTITHMGGSGITTLVNRVDDKDIIANGDVEDLLIAHNSIVQCVLLPPDTLLNDTVVVAGGIVLSAVTQANIHHNSIRENGVSVQQDPAGGQSNDYPACGIFTLDCAGLEITDNAITDNGSAQVSDNQKINAFQAGIAALLVFGNNIDVSDLAAGKLELQAGLPAARIHDNVVSCPAGHALVAIALGSVSVQGNTLTTQALKRQPPLFGGQLPNLSACVFILNLGRASFLSNSLAGFGVNSTVKDTSAAAAAPTAYPDGRILFSTNQVTFTSQRADVKLVPSVIALWSLDDVNVQGNQVLSQIAGGKLITAGLAAGLTVRSSGNYFNELPLTAALSYLSWGILNAMTSNESIHCMIALGTKVSEANNLTVFPAELCQQLAKALSPQG